MAKVEKWTVFRTRYTPTLWPLLTYWSWPAETELKVKPGATVHVWKIGHITAYREASGMKRMAAAALEILKKNTGNLGDMRSQAVKAGEEAVKFTKAFASRAKTATLEEFAQFLEEFTPVYQKVIRKSMVYWIYTSTALEPAVKKILEKYKEEHASEIFSTMSLPVEKTYSAIEEEEFEKTVETAREKGIESQEATNAIGNFSAKYFWFPYEYVGPEVWDVKTVTLRVKEALANRHGGKKEENTVEMQKQCIARHKLSSEAVNLFKIMQVIALMQDDRKMYQAQTCYYLDKVIIAELARRLGETLEKTRWIDQNLLREYIKIKNLHWLKSKLEERSKLCVFANLNNYIQLVEGEKARVLLKEQGISPEEDYSEVKEFKGQPANKGYAKGKARVLLSPDANAEFNEGDILVTNMTTPNFINFIKKAGAIVTNEGGITCHAAIISRELGKPCIIGTKIATKAIKDGQEIEVDADKGIVKILS